MRIAIAAVLGLIAAGCVTSKPVMAPDGSRGFYIECPRDKSVCMDEAARLCPGGYNVLDAGQRVSHIQQTYASASGGPGFATGQSTTTSTPIWRGNITISCRERPAAQYVAPQTAPACPVAKGNYRVHLEKVNGTCATFDDVLVDYDGVSWVVPPRCEGSATPDGCSVKLDYKCPPDANGLAMKHVENTRWTSDGASGTGTVEMAFSNEGNSCRGQYVITYTRL